jgi:hypothetical protein
MSAAPTRIFCSRPYEKIDTGRVPNRRVLRFHTYQDLLDEVERLAQLGDEVPVLGNWTRAQIVEHLALAMAGSIDGMPRAPFLLRFFGRVAAVLMGRWILEDPPDGIRGGMPSGFFLTGRMREKLEPERTVLMDDAVQDLRHQIERLEETPPTAKHPLLGRLSKSKWKRFHLLHAAHHLSFARP